MLSSIHPLGERSRNNRWSLTVAAFTIAAGLTAAGIGAGLGALGSVLNWDTQTGLLLTAVVAVAAGTLDLIRANPPGPERQVNEHWIGYYRGVVYGAGFGAQLGSGILTFVVTWGVYATFVGELFSGTWLSGALVGLVFGLGRSIALLLAGWIKDPSTLTAFHQRMALLGNPTRIATGLATTSLGLVVTIGVLL